MKNKELELGELEDEDTQSRWNFNTRTSLDSKFLIIVLQKSCNLVSYNKFIRNEKLNAQQITGRSNSQFKIERLKRNRDKQINYNKPDKHARKVHNNITIEG